MKTTTVADRNWEYLLGLLPADWKELAHTTGAITRLRGFAAEDQLLRALLLHVALGCSLRDTVVVAKAAGWLDLSDVALLKKLRQSERWLQALCVGLLRDSELALPSAPPLRMRLIDGTHVKEPGQTGSQWRMHFSLQVPQWSCDYFAVTSSKGVGNGESLRRFPVRAKDCLIADRGYAQAAGIGHVQSKGGYCIVLTTVPTELLTAAQILEWYRVRWQIELAFKRLKSLAGFGHLPKFDPRSSRAWLYGKLLVALLTDKMPRHAQAFSPWGVRWCEPEAFAQSVAGAEVLAALN